MSLSEQLNLLIREELGMNPYSVSTLLAQRRGLTEDKDRRAIERRWQRVTKGDNFRLQEVERDLIDLGYVLSIEEAA